MADVFSRETHKIDFILKTINLEHLISNFSKKCVTLDTFFNLTEEELVYLGISDEPERKKILKEIKPYQARYQTFYQPIKLDLDKILKQCSKQMQLIRSMVSYLSGRAIKLAKRENPLVDESTSTATAMIHICTELNTQLNYLEDEVRDVLKIQNKRKKLSYWWLVGFFTVSIGSYFAMHMPKMRQVL